jgi:hypothetical protein
MPLESLSAIPRLRPMILEKSSLKIVETDAMLGGFGFHLADECAVFQQGLGGNAAPVQAGAAEVFLLDAEDFFLQLPRADGGGITGGAAAEDEDVVVEFWEAAVRGLAKAAVPAEGAPPANFFLYLLDVFFAGGDDGEQAADGDLFALLDQDQGERSGIERFHLHDGFVGFDLGDLFVCLDAVALFFEPFYDGPLGHRVGQLRHRHFSGH